MTTFILIVLAGGTMLLLSLLAAYVLGWANRVFHVPVDPKMEAVQAALPGANCGGCGYVGCNEYAAALVAGTVAPSKCTVGGVSCAKALADILGLELQETWPYRPAVHCGARYADRLGRSEYRGEPTCAAANIIGGVQACAYGCLGLDDCQVSCRYDAIHVLDGLAIVDYDRCVGCGACERACPRHLITMVPFKAETMVVVTCANEDFGKDVKAVCKVGCIGCGACMRINELFKIQDNLPRIDYDKYDPAKVSELTAALEKCPMKRLAVMGKPSARDLVAVADRQVPGVIGPDFKTTVDATDWRG